MVNPTKKLGTKLESDIVGWLQAHGWKYAHRRTQKGSADEGDVCLSESVPFTLEAKNSKRSTDRAAIGTWLRELEAEVSHVGDEGGAVIHKRRGTADVGEYVVIMPVKFLNDLLLRVYQVDEVDEVDEVDGDSAASPKRKRLIPRSQR